MTLDTSHLGDLTRAPSSAFNSSDFSDIPFVPHSIVALRFCVDIFLCACQSQKQSQSQSPLQSQNCRTTSASFSAQPGLFSSFLSTHSPISGLRRLCYLLSEFLLNVLSSGGFIQIRSGCLLVHASTKSSDSFPPLSIPLGLPGLTAELFHSLFGLDIDSLVRRHLNFIASPIPSNTSIAHDVRDSLLSIERRRASRFSCSNCWSICANLITLLSRLTGQSVFFTLSDFPVRRAQEFSETLTEGFLHSEGSFRSLFSSLDHLDHTSFPVELYPLIPRLPPTSPFKELVRCGYLASNCALENLIGGHGLTEVISLFYDGLLTHERIPVQEVWLGFQPYWPDHYTGPAHWFNPDGRTCIRWLYPGSSGGPTLIDRRSLKLIKGSSKDCQCQGQCIGCCDRCSDLSAVPLFTSDEQNLLTRGNRSDERCTLLPDPVLPDHPGNPTNSTVSPPTGQPEGASIEGSITAAAGKTESVNQDTNITTVVDYFKEAQFSLADKQSLGHDTDVTDNIDCSEETQSSFTDDSDARHHSLLTIN